MYVCESQLLEAVNFLDKAVDQGSTAAVPFLSPNSNVSVTAFLF